MRIRVLVAASVYSQLIFAQFTSWNFDWDDNVMFMPTKIVIFAKNSLEPREISTSEFAEHRKYIGISGTFADYHILTTTSHNSFCYFRDHKTENYFLNHIREILQSGKHSDACGPSFKNFQFALSHLSTARWTTIITTRGHSRTNIIEGLRELQKYGLIKYLPPEENIFTITSNDVRALLQKEFNCDFSTDPAKTKTLVMEYKLNQLNQEPLDQNGEKHLWGFSDDDLNYFNTAIERLSKKVTNWPNVKIALYYTGSKPEAHPVVILEQDGSVRDMLPEEKYEFRNRARRQHAEHVIDNAKVSV